MLGRADDVLVTGGENVSPAAVERVLLAEPGVEDAVVVGVPDLEWGQAVVALVVGGTRRTHRHAGCGPPWPTGSGAATPRATCCGSTALPRARLGKIDRRAAAELAARTLSG